MSQNRKKTFNHVINLPDTIVKTSDGSEYVLTRCKDGKSVELKRKTQSTKREAPQEVLKNEPKSNPLSFLKNISFKHVAVAIFVLKGLMTIHEKYFSSKPEVKKTSKKDMGLDEDADVEAFIKDHGLILELIEDGCLSEKAIEELRDALDSIVRFGAVLPDGTFRPASGIAPLTADHFNTALFDKKSAEPRDESLWRIQEGVEEVEEEEEAKEEGEGDEGSQEEKQINEDVAETLKVSDDRRNL
uniref:Uncharacterized protein n=1 Tax=Polytomella parva TaxID=51329 RepID=A0A7S0UJY5_9CHLO|mmetsp:Transcript_1127/g.1652  ORF Transcript_1127/g.1652 Transcript_1127/m.1652 type:complete len:244 (+) Transcript_1127:244-975(+)|eukprot:CAMPEP_0175068120 /NCGR_PEP_ID=MMETSP0052_2-20121109/17495_1 /TAXON_ID=51329 ORGANISM="Polytomella parva, Strain SAG 63-3" /NCGR_SAMPLE_ID=MMETSP0052_2 /ASSEMBLY_ACC=CAM_ASM_000194 /LENGTH=243 /DNA_ID=CAMNT_0016335113 /DNA_START=445 /DNA_END=1176 /DNA_ORIENTATION=-